MKTIRGTERVDIPEGITVSVKNRIVTVEGPRGKLVRNFRHAQIDMKKEGNQIVVDKWFGSRKELSVVHTICSHIQNMYVGVTKVRSLTPV